MKTAEEATQRLSEEERERLADLLLILLDSVPEHPSELDFRLRYRLLRAAVYLRGN